MVTGTSRRTQGSPVKLMRSTAFAALAATTLLLFPGFAVSDVTWPSCNDSSLAWTYNSLSQSPCQVAAYLQSTCWQGGYDLWALQWEWEYIGPRDKNESNLCLCNTVAYSTLCACGACQDHNWISWQEWVVNCTTVMPPATFPNPIPSPIQIPHWALIDVTRENFWDPVTAKSAGDSPEIGPGTLIGTSGTSAVPTGTATPTSSSGSGSSNTSAIVGGVVGAIATLVFAIVIFGIFYVRRRKRKRAERAMAEDTIIESSSIPDPDPFLTSTPGRTSNPTDPTNDMLRPEMQATPWVPNVSSHVVSGPYQGSGSTLPMQLSSELPPQYSELPTDSAQPPTPSHDQSRSPRQPQK